jgi:hypothetical protein
MVILEMLLIQLFIGGIYSTTAITQINKYIPVITFIKLMRKEENSY